MDIAQLHCNTRLLGYVCLSVEYPNFDQFVSEHTVEIGTTAHMRRVVAKGVQRLISAIGKRPTIESTTFRVQSLKVLTDEFKTRDDFCIVIKLT